VAVSGQETMTPEALAESAEDYMVNKEAAFTAMRVAALLSKRLQGDPARLAGMEDALSVLPEGALDNVAEAALPAAEGVRAAVLTILACAADPQLRPAVVAAMEQQASSRQMLATGVLEAGLVVGVLLLIGKAEIRRAADGKWEFHLHAIDNAALVELAKFGTALLKKIPG
jgi:hypothetical protein